MCVCVCVCVSEMKLSSFWQMFRGELEDTGQLGAKAEKAEPGLGRMTGRRGQI